MRYLLCVLLAVSAAAAGAQEGDLAQKEVAALQGAWKVVSLNEEGRKVPEAKIKERIGDGRLTFAGNKVSFKNPKGEKEEGTYKVDPTGRPKTIDVMPGTGDAKGKTLLGLYNLEGDELTLCIGGLDDPRPAKIEGGRDITLMVLKREKKP
jgi:uncharacterized protein (TIGR03067 family)